MNFLKKHWAKIALAAVLVISYIFLIQIKDVKYIEWNVRDGRIKNLHYAEGELLEVIAMYKEAVSNPEGYEIEFEMIGEVDINTLGEYPVIYRAEENGVISEIHVTYVVRDVREPVVTLIGGEEITIPRGGEYIEPGYTAEDAYDGDVTHLVQTEIIDTTDDGFAVQYTVTDSNGNSCETKRIVTYEE